MVAPHSRPPYRRPPSFAATLIGGAVGQRNVPDAQLGDGGSKRADMIVDAADFPERLPVDGVSDTATTVSRGKALVTFTLPGKPDANGQRVEATLAGSVTAIYQQIGFRPLRDYRVIHFG